MTNWGPGTCGLNPQASMALSHSLRYLQPKGMCYNSGTPQPGPLDTLHVTRAGTTGSSVPLAKGGLGVITLSACIY